MKINGGQDGQYKSNNLDLNYGHGLSPKNNLSLIFTNFKNDNMKNKDFVIGLLSGVCLCLCTIIIMGFSSVTPPPSSSQVKYLPVVKDGRIYKLNTQTGNHSNSRLWMD